MLHAFSTATLVLAQAAAPAAPAGAPPSLLSGPMVPFICMGIIFYFLLIRPQQKKQKELQKLITELKTGDKVVTTGGIHGIVANVRDGAVLSLKIADGVKIEIDKSAIATVDRSGSSSATSSTVATTAA